MSTIRYVHPTLGPYTTLQAAYDAANPDDVVMLTSGTYLASGTSYPPAWNKKVHIIGESGADSTTISGALNIVLPAYVSGMLLVEGISIRVAANVPPFSFYGDAASTAATEIRVNRCRVLATDNFCGPNAALGIQKYRITLEQLTHTRTSDRSACLTSAGVTLRGPHDISGSEVRLLRVHRHSTIPEYSGNPACSALPMCILDTVTSATVGYGHYYGVWYRDQVMGTHYAITGQLVLPPGVDRSAADIRLFRETSAGLIEPIPWVHRVPDAVSGEWAFDYLPTTHRYWVQTIPPPGYRPRIDGPYLPVAG